MIEPRPVHRRGTAGIFRGAEYDNRVGGPCRRFTRRVDDAKSGIGKEQQKRARHGEQQKQPGTSSGDSFFFERGVILQHRSRKSFDNFFRGDCPFPLNFPGASWLNCTIVDNAARGDAPPSTISEIRS